MTHEKGAQPDPITNFLREKAPTPTAQELKRLKSVEQKRRARALRKNLDWRTNAKDSDPGL